MKVQKNADRTIDLLADASFDSVDRFVVNGQKVTFKVKGQDALLRAKPPLLGLQSAESLKSLQDRIRLPRRRIQDRPGAGGEAQGGDPQRPRCGSTSARGARSAAAWCRRS